MPRRRSRTRSRRRLFHWRRRLLWAIAGAVAGCLLAVPVSYLIQPGIVRGLYNISEYCREVILGLPDVMSGGSDLLGCGQRVALTAAIMAGLGGYVGFCLAPRRGRG
jgi:hypothetical protein